MPFASLMAADPAPAPPGQLFVRRTQLLAFTIWLLFVAYAGGQLLQSSVNNDLGFYCLVEIYLVFGICALVAPFIVGRFDLRLLIASSSSLYVIFTGVNINPLPAPLLLSCLGVGLAAPVLWSAQSLYVAKAAAAYSEETGLAVTKANSLLNTAFYTIFTSSGGVSAVLVAVFILLGSSDTHGLFVLLTAIGASGVLLMLFLAPPGAKTGGVLHVPAFLEPLLGKGKETSGSLAVATAPAPAGPAPSKPPSVLFMLRFLLTEKRILLAAPLIFEVGFVQGLFNGAFVGQIVKPSVQASLGGSGLAAVGIVGAVQSFCSAIATRAWSPYLQRDDFGRRWAFVYGVAAHAIFLLFLTVWSYAYREGDWPGSSACLAAYIFFVLLWSIGDSVMWSQIPAVLQTYFPAAPQTPCAMSGIRLFSALGTAASVAFSVTLSNSSSGENASSSSLLWTQCAFGLCLLAFAAYCLRHLHARVCSLDSSGDQSSAKTTSASASGSASAENDKSSLKQHDGNISDNKEIDLSSTMTATATWTVTLTAADSSASSSSSFGGDDKLDSGRYHYDALTGKRGEATC